jgi:aspartate dehydrogenase
MIKVSLIGCGNIGTELARFLDKDKRFSLKCISDINKSNSKALLSGIKSRPKIVSIKEAIIQGDLIIEAANKEVVKEILKYKGADKKGKALLVMSTGGLTENYSSLQRLKYLEVHIPAGAIAGIDAIKSCSGKINYLSLSTTKPSYSLTSAPFVIKNKIDVNGLKQKRKIFDGNLREAINGFPQNINVAASLFLASHFRKVRIQIFADPITKFNTHEIICRGNFGEIHTITENRPCINPKTSYLAILSATSVLDNIVSKIKIGN